MFVGMSGITLAISLPVTLLVESPMMGLEKILLGIGKKPQNNMKKTETGDHQGLAETGRQYDNNAFNGDVTSGEGTFDVPGGAIRLVVEPPTPDCTELNPPMLYQAPPPYMASDQPSQANISIQSNHDDGGADDEDLDEAATYDPKSRAARKAQEAGAMTHQDRGQITSVAHDHPAGN